MCSCPTQMLLPLCMSLRIMRLAAEEEKAQSVILDMSNVVYIDTSGIAALEELHKELTSTGLQVGYADLKWRLIHKLKLASFVERVGRERFFLSVGEAIDAFPSPSKIALAALDSC